METSSIRTRLAVLCASVASIGTFAPAAPAPIAYGVARTAQIELMALSVNPTSVVGGDGATGTLTLTDAAPSGGLVVSLSSSNPSAATVPASVIVAPRTSSRTFTIGTNPVASLTSVTVTATLGSTTRTTTLEITTAAPPSSLTSITLDPSTVTAGKSASGTVTLASAASGSGLFVKLSSSIPSVATVPESVTVQPGATSATFTVSTSAVSSSTKVTITGTGGGATCTATLTANPEGVELLPPPALVAPEHDARFVPGQQITFDWSDVSGAAGYLLEIDEHEAFPAPVVQETTSASQFGTAALPVRALWWRACALDAAGNPGAWSSIRRFEVKG